jgi:hypothetical protein
MIKNCWRYGISMSQMITDMFPAHFVVITIWSFPHSWFITGFVTTTAATSGAGTANPSGAPEITLVFSRFHVARSLVFCVVFSRSLFVFFISTGGVHKLHERNKIYNVTQTSAWCTENVALLARTRGYS